MSAIDEPAAGESPGSGAHRAWVLQQLDTLRHELEAELRARRVVVVDRDNQPVIILSCEADVASIEVCARGDKGGVSVEMTAHAGPADRAAALSLTRRGNVIAALTVTDSDEGALCRLVFEDMSAAGRPLVIDADGTRYA